MTEKHWSGPKESARARRPLGVAPAPAEWTMYSLIVLSGIVVVEGDAERHL